MPYSELDSAIIITQITMELQAAHIYRGYAHYFNHPDVSCPGFSKYFMRQSTEELQHADAFICYHQNRGGKYDSPALLSSPNCHSPLEAVEKCLCLEQDVLDNLIKVHNLGDQQTQIFVEHYIDHQTKAIGEVKSLLSKLKRLNDDTGIYLVDRELL